MAAMRQLGRNFVSRTAGSLAAATQATGGGRGTRLLCTSGVPPSPPRPSRGYVRLIADHSRKLTETFFVTTQISCAVVFLSFGVCDLLEIDLADKIITWYDLERDAGDDQ
ncbi:hypothetical protein ACH5RR_030588 [Cinchona calisaya]|uniref:Uncharacterized protein n=1 Tax=Cinchona calisaya TaxID=153742 RepID=A0ABD2YZB4_9GENT